MSKFAMRCLLAAAALIAVPASAMADETPAPQAGGGTQPAYQGALPAGGAMRDRAVAAWWATPGVGIGLGAAAVGVVVLLLTNNNGSNSSTTGTGN
jgi:hypothetical protein